MTELPSGATSRSRSDVSEELQALRDEAEHLRRALSSRAEIDQGKGVLMMRYGISAERAFDVLVRWSQHANVKLRVVAVAVLKVSSREPVESRDQLSSWVAEQLRGAAPGAPEKDAPSDEPGGRFGAEAKVQV